MNQLKLKSTVMTVCCIKLCYHYYRRCQHTVDFHQDYTETFKTVGVVCPVKPQYYKSSNWLLYFYCHHVVVYFNGAKYFDFPSSHLGKFPDGMQSLFVVATKSVLFPYLRVFGDWTEKRQQYSGHQA